MKKLVLFLYTTFCIFHSLPAQDSCRLRISLLTCAPGSELYSIFGHTAIRVQDLSAGSDSVYNYGMFEFAPDFYSKFIRGKLFYSLSVEGFHDFLYTYQVESRSIVEQALQLNCEEKQKLYAALQINALEQNKYYRYDFLFDNCTTRAKDMITRNTNVPVVFKNILPKKIPSFRDLLHSYLDRGNQPWSKLGIDVLLGVRLDSKVSNEQAMFLPDWLLKGFDSAANNNRPLVMPSQPVLEMPSPLSENSFFTPAIIFSLLLCMGIVFSLLKQTWARTVINIFDFLFFFSLGMAGVLLLFMWFGTDHVVCRNNYNLLWALPTHVVMAFFIHKNAGWSRHYFKLVFWLSLAVLLTWLILPQQMNASLIPVLLLITYRSWFLSKRNFLWNKKKSLSKEKDYSIGA